MMRLINVNSGMTTRSAASQSESELASMLERIELDEGYSVSHQ